MMEAREFEVVVESENFRPLLVATKPPKRRISKAHRAARRILAFAALILMETAPSILAGILVGIMVVPAAYAERGYIAFGGEWLLIMIAMFGTHYVVHKAIFKRMGLL